MGTHHQPAEDEAIMSDDDDSNDLGAHRKLLASIQALGSNKKQKNVIRGVPLALTPNNLDLAVHSSKGTSKISAKDLKFQQLHGTRKVKKPLSSGELDSAKRQIARYDMKKDGSKWEPVVEQFRVAPQVDYTAPSGKRVELQAHNTTRDFTPRTPLEMELFAALGKSEDVLHPKKELTAAEEKALKAMSVQEARARRAELLRHYSLLGRMQQKMKRQKKIKSKNYRRILRKEKEASDKKQLEQLQHTDPEAFLERMEQLEEARMEERLTLKHRGGGKFSRLHKAYSKFDDKTRDKIQDMIQKSKELTQKRQVDSSSDDDDEDDNNVGSKAGQADSDDDFDVNAISVDAQMKDDIEKISKKAGGWLDGPTQFVYNKRAVELATAKRTSEEDGDAAEIVETPQDACTQSTAVSETEVMKPKKKKKKVNDDIDDGTNPEMLVKPTKKNAGSSSVTETGGMNKTNNDGENKSKKKKKKNVKEAPAEQSASKIKKRKATEMDTGDGCEVIITKKEKKRKKQLDDALTVTAEMVTKEGSFLKSAAAKAEEAVALMSESNEKRQKENDHKKEEETKNNETHVKDAILQSVDDDGDDDNDDDLNDNMKVSMEELFEDEDFVEEFIKEKEQLEDENKPKVSDLSMPGWGQWAGPDYKEVQKRKAEAKAKRKKKKQDKPDPRSKLVWLNPKRDVNIRQYQPKQVPYPFTTVEQYEASLRQPMSRGLVRETAHLMLTKPELVTKQGHIIQPLDKDNYFKKEGAAAAAQDDDKNFGHVDEDLKELMKEFDAPKSKKRKVQKAGKRKSIS